MLLLCTGKLVNAPALVIRGLDSETSVAPGRGVSAGILLSGAVPGGAAGNPPAGEAEVQKVSRARMYIFELGMVLMLIVCAASLNKLEVEPPDFQVVSSPLHRRTHFRRMPRSASYTLTHASENKVICEATARSFLCCHPDHASELHVLTFRFQRHCAMFPSVLCSQLCYGLRT